MASPLLLVLAVLVIALVALRMRTRRYYFIRHGETVLNAEHIKQGAEGGLSETGKRQARVVGAELAPLGIDKIISSPYERAKETAAIIAEAVHARVRYTPLLIERKNPSEIIGKNRDDDAVKHVIDLMDLAYHADDYHYADEENFVDLKARARRCLRYLEWQGAPQTCVVTHHVFLKMLLSYALYGEQLHAADYVKLSYFNASDNGGISICDYRPWKFFSKTRGWEIVSYNETIQ